MCVRIIALLIFLLIVFFDLQCGCRMLNKFPKFFEGRYQAVELMQSSGTDLDISRILAVVLHFQFVSIDLEVCRS